MADRSFSCPEEMSEGVVEGGKVVAIHIHATPETGLVAMFSQLGVEVPSA